MIGTSNADNARPYRLAPFHRRGASVKYQEETSEKSKENGSGRREENTKKMKQNQRWQTRVTT
jgi:hypothetical protein